MKSTVEIYVNGEKQIIPKQWTIGNVVDHLVNPSGPVAVELNEKILRRDLWEKKQIKPGDQIEVVHFVGGGESNSYRDKDVLFIGKYQIKSRLIVGTGKYKNNELMRRALVASGADMVTVAVRRVNIRNRSESLLKYIDKKQFQILPNTAGCYSAKDAVRCARLGREAGLSSMVKLEVIGDKQTLFPDNEELLKATKTLVSEGFTVLPYTNDDPVVCKKLEDLGAEAVMPLGAPIGSGLGIQNPNNIYIIRKTISVPLIVDAGVGTASDAALAMELGADGVLMNTGIAEAQDPVSMAHSMRLSVKAGRLAYRAGRIPRRRYARASSPLEGLITG